MSTSKDKFSLCGVNSVITGCPIAQDTSKEHLPLEQGSEKYNPTAKFRPWPAFRDNVLLQHSHSHCFTYCLYVHKWQSRVVGTGIKILISRPFIEDVGQSLHQSGLSCCRLWVLL